MAAAGGGRVASAGRANCRSALRRFPAFDVAVGRVRDHCRRVLRAKTREVVSQPEGVIWEPESFTLRFSDDGKAADYECNYGTETFRAILSAP